MDSAGEYPIAIKYYGRTELYNQLIENEVYRGHVDTFRRWYRNAVFDNEELAIMDMRYGFTPGEVKRILDYLL